MVYASSLCFTARKALDSKCIQATVPSITEQLPIDPDLTNMHVVLLSAKDLTGHAGKKLRAAVQSRHSAVCVIYMYVSEREGQLFPEAPCSVRVKSITVDAIRNAISEFYTPPVKQVVEQRPFEEPPEPLPQIVEEEPAEIAPEPSTVPPLDLPILEGIPQPQPAPPPEDYRSPEDSIASVKDVRDWGVLKQQLNRDAVIRALILENNEFAGVVNMLNVWDLRIRDVWTNPHMTSEEKMRAVQEFGSNRQTLQATHNSVLVSKFVSLMERVVSVCVQTVEERCGQISKAVVSMETNKEAFLEMAVSGTTDPYDKLYNSMMELQCTQGELCKLFSFMHAEGMDEILKRFDENLPSSNDFINNTLTISAKLYLPGNSAHLGEILMEALHKGQVQLSMVEDKITALMDTLFRVIEQQHDVIRYQRDVISCLRANNVESIVVRNSLLKDCFQVFAGCENTGLSSTVAMVAGMKSRVHNTLVVDLTGHAHYARYGFTTLPLEEFLVDRVQKPLLMVVGDPMVDPENVQMLLEELKARLSYYHNLIVVLDPVQKPLFDQIGREARSISYLTNCTPESMSCIADLYKDCRGLPNVAHRLLCIDSPVDMGSLLASLKMDISLTQLIPIPYLREMRQAAIVGQQPHTYADLLRVFEEAFRV